jgi:hypothetical protein
MNRHENQELKNLIKSLTKEKEYKPIWQKLHEEAE